MIAIVPGMVLAPSTVTKLLGSVGSGVVLKTVDPVICTVWPVADAINITATPPLT
jgi:hypothetical protein